MGDRKHLVALVFLKKGEACMCFVIVKLPSIHLAFQQKLDIRDYSLIITRISLTSLAIGKTTINERERERERERGREKGRERECVCEGERERVHRIDERRLKSVVWKTFYSISNIPRNTSFMDAFNFAVIYCDTFTASSIYIYTRT